ncbi:hypothetical protein FB451DRAFT_1553081 [Mycena latifolia]|nr:hypothetical protein FB451DRAFT_1553081 [Mycena latifolia]
MDPLKLSDLHLVENWNSFNPKMEGYIEPGSPDADIDLWYPDGCMFGIEDQFRELASSEYMRDNDSDAPVVALSVVQNFPTTSLTIRDETFTVPLSSREMKFLGTFLGKGRSKAPHASRYTVKGDEVKILNDASHSAITARQIDVLEKLGASFGHVATPVALDVFKAGSHELSTTAAEDSHFATIFVILPTFSTANIRVRATYGTVTSAVQLPDDLRESVSAIGVYAGVSDARIKVGAGGEIICITFHVCAENEDFVRLEDRSGALSPLRDAFCVWRDLLNMDDEDFPGPARMLFILDGRPKSARDFKGADATLLCHLAPLAKAYEFSMYIGQLVHISSTEQEVSHGYKQYFGLNGPDLDPSVLRMSKDPEVEYEWTGLQTLGRVNVKNPALLERATQMVTKNEYLQAKLLKVDVRDEYEIEGDSLNSATVIYRHIRTASILFIVP